MRLIYLALGWTMVALGVVGVFLPVLPTTPFLLLAAWLFARSSNRFERWLLTHPFLGPPLQDWREHGAIPRRGKAIALVMMAASFVVFWWRVEPSPLWAAVVAAILLGSGTFIVTRPDRPR
ncbi:YbaN family protein [Rhizobiaceae bacterium n13]|uniref:YbaN family protein n=1 Tax=Ferirhizobium litorale TaxID=2927786 RepID=A0AAE3QED6_9HYPH|nr:YbaN family protein [Fererhizobium litorale]MDI7861842.1 YbaN family protein [Fererhizobium litorale]MDI7921816.1 YbaN family protein [Fererhizobium litorale]